MDLDPQSELPGDSGTGGSRSKLESVPLWVGQGFGSCFPEEPVGNVGL